MIIRTSKRQCSWVTLLLLIVTLTVFRLITLISDERFIFLGLAISLVLTQVLHEGRQIKLKWTGYHWYLILFTLFTYVSSIWALDTRYTIGRGNTMLLSTIVLIAMSYCFKNARDIDQMLQVIMWSGFLIAYLAIYIFGIGGIIQSIRGSTRIGLNNEFINTNEIGMCAAYSILITIYFILYKKKWHLLILDVPAVLVVLATEGKKAILIIGLGAISLFYLKNCLDRDFRKRFAKAIGLIILIAIAATVLLTLPAFKGIRDRFEIMFKALSGSGSEDLSTSTRVRLIEIGTELFHSNPILGIGINNAHFIAGAEFNHEDYYLHNNYIELLADGGLIGFTIYYSIYVYLLFKLWKLRDFKDGGFNICFTFLIINLGLDFATVSFLDRTTYFYLLMYYIQYGILKQKWKLIAE